MRKNQEVNRIPEVLWKDVWGQGAGKYEIGLGNKDRVVANRWEIVLAVTLFCQKFWGLKMY